MKRKPMTAYEDSLGDSGKGTKSPFTRNKLLMEEALWVG